MTDAIPIVLVGVSVSAVWAAYLAPWIRRCSVNTDELNIELKSTKDRLRETYLRQQIAELKLRLHELEAEGQKHHGTQTRVPGKAKTSQPPVYYDGGT